MVSIIMPVYNGENYLEKSIESVLRQSYYDFELILVDDGSEDKSGSICDWYAAKDLRVKVSHTSNHGVSAARRYGYEQAGGEWIAFMDDDDILAPWYLLSLLEYSDGKDIVGGGGIDISSHELDKVDFESIRFSRGKKYEFSGIQAAQLFNAPNDCRFGIVTLLWGKIIRREVMKRVILLIEQYQEVIPLNCFEDIFVVPRLFLNAENVVIRDELMYYHRNCADSPSHTLKMKEYNYEQIEVVKLNLQYYKEENHMELYEGQLPHGYLIILKIWYAGMKYEQDQAKKAWCDKKVKEYYDFYLADLKHNRYMSTTYKFIIYLYGKNKKLWSLLVGHLYFNCLYKYRTLFIK